MKYRFLHKRIEFFYVELEIFFISTYIRECASKLILYPYPIILLVCYRYELLISIGLSALVKQYPGIKCTCVYSMHVLP